MTAMLIEWVATASFLILVVLLLRGLLGRHISAGLRYALWAMVLVRLLVPVQLFTSPVVGTNVFSDLYTEHTVADNIPAPVQSVAPAGDQLQGGVNVIQTGPALSVPGTVPNAPAAPNVPQAPASPQPTAELLTVLGWVWLGGSAAMGLALLASNVRFIRRLRRSRIPLDDVGCPLRVYAAVGLNSPCLFGLVRPAVYVTPEAMANPAMLRHVLAHEATHRRHLDHIWNALRCVALAVHWWNPLAWLAVVLSRRDGELACDEGALKRLGDGERRAYGHTLLALVTARPRPADLLCCATTMAGDKRSLMERVSRIAKKPRRLVWAAVAAVLILILACACAFGRAEDPEPGPEGDQHVPSEHWGPEVDLTDVPEEVRAAALDYGKSVYEDFLSRLELREPPVDVEFDDWRVEALEGPWTKTAQGTEVGVWRLDYTCHTPEPERAKVLLAGGMVLSEDGWMTPTDSITWLIFLKDGDGKWQYSHAMQGDASATDQPDSDLFWRRATNGIPSVTDPHFTADVTGVPGDVLSMAAFYAEDRFNACNAAIWQFSTLPDGAVPEPGQIEFDDWRIDYLRGPWRETVDGTETEVWRMNYELHTTQPERAEQAIVGGMYLTEDGWFCPTYPTCTYLIWTKGGDGGWRYYDAMMANSCSPEEGGTPEQFWEYVADMLKIFVPEPENSNSAQPVYNMGVQPWETDLNRNGVPETISLVEVGNGGVQLLVLENGETVHEDNVGSLNSYFLCTLDGQDYLLWYHPDYDPELSNGHGSYAYGLLDLAKGPGAVKQGGYMSFDTHFGSDEHEFDVEEIADFMDQLNGLLAHSVEIVNTYPYLKETFDRTGRLYDDLWWLDEYPETFTRDAGKSLRENLRDYQAAMEHSASGWEYPVVSALDDQHRHFQLSYMGNSVEFGGPDSAYQYDMNPCVMDLNGDGRNEIVFTAKSDHSNGYRQETLYIFDAETLERYDTDDIVEQARSQIQSTGDGENFYLSAPGMERVTLPKSIVRDWDGFVEWTVFDAIEFAWCWYFDVDPDLGTLSLVMWGNGSTEVVFCAGIRVELKLTETGVETGRFEFVPDPAGETLYTY